MAQFKVSPVRFLALPWRAALVAALAAAACGILAPTVGTAHAASPHALLDCPTVPVPTSAIYHTIPGDPSNTQLPGIGGWVGDNDMVVQISNACATYSGIVIDTNGNFTNLPATMLPGTYDMTTSTDSTYTTYTCALGTVIPLTTQCELQNTTFSLTTDTSTGATTETVDGSILCSGNIITIVGKVKVSITQFIGGPVGGVGTSTPELGSAELLTAGLLPVLGLLAFRRRRRRAARDEGTAEA